MVVRSPICLEWQDHHDGEEKPSLVIELDASTQGWGAFCKGTWTGGPWHINCLEALTAFHAVKCFVRDKKSITVLLRVYNTTGATYVNKLGGTVSPKLGTMALVHEPGYYSGGGAFTCSPQYNCRPRIPSVMRDRSDWMLNPRILNRIQQKCGPLEVDMFASRLTTQLKRFFSWRPDPEAEALDAFNQNWAEYNNSRSLWS